MLLVKFLMSLTAGLVSPWLGSQKACAKGGGEPAVVTVRTCSARNVNAREFSGSAPAPRIAVAGEPNGACVMVAAPPAKWEAQVEPAEEDGTINTAPTTAPIAPIEAGGPWLGVQFGPISQPLSSHLRLDEGVGQMILNVVEGSPADQAGFQQYDVITQFDGQSAPSDIEKFMEIVRGFQPGQAHSVTLYRQGQQQPATLVVGTRPDQIGKYKYEMEPQETTRCEVIGRGGLLEKDDQGNWIFKQFDFNDMPNVWTWLPEGDDQTCGIQLHDDGTGTRQIVVNRSAKGRSTRIERDEHGQFTVTTTERVNGKESSVTHTYENEEALKAQSPEAYEVFKEQGGDAFMSPSGAKPFGWLWKKHGEAFPEAFGPEFNVELDERIGELMKDLETRNEAMGRNLEGRIQEHLKGLENLREGDAATRFRFHQKDDAPVASLPSDEDDAFESQPRTSFDVDADGQIRVTVRRGSEEMVQTYKDEAALKAVKPDLYEKYRRLQDGE